MKSIHSRLSAAASLLLIGACMISPAANADAAAPERSFVIPVVLALVAGGILLAVRYIRGNYMAAKRLIEDALANGRASTSDLKVFITATKMIGSPDYLRHRFPERPKPGTIAYHGKGEDQFLVIPATEPSSTPAAE